MASSTRGRPARKSETRKQLLEAAARVVAEKGFAGASLMDIAEEAKLTTGAVYSNFRGKEELLLALVTDQLDRTGSDVPETVEEVLAQAREAATLESDPGVQEVLRAQVEVYLLGLRDPAVRRVLQEREAALAGALARVLAGVDVARVPAAPVPSLEQLAEVFFATLQGLQQHRLMFPEAVPAAVFDWWVTVVLRAAAETAKEAPPD